MYLLRSSVSVPCHENNVSLEDGYLKSVELHISFVQNKFIINVIRAFYARKYILEILHNDLLFLETCDPTDPIILRFFLNVLIHGRCDHR